MPFEDLNVRLPEDLEEKTLRGLLPGESAWSVPWAMAVDSKRRLWIKATFTGEDEPGGTVDMHVTRTEDGFVVDISRVRDPEWPMQYAMDADEMDEQDPHKPEYLPVVQLIR